MKKGTLFYFVGRSGSGKTTIANIFSEKLKMAGIRSLQVIDGDVIRAQFGGIFGYTFEERMKANQAARVVAQYLVDNGINVILTQVGGYREMRENTRNQFEPRYIQVYVKCSLEGCAERDVKGYYKSQTANINGLNDTYEEPVESEVTLDTEKYNAEQCAETLMLYLKANKYDL